MIRVYMLFTCPRKGKPMESQNKVEAMKGLGLKGDRYATGKGTYSGLPNKSDRQKSLRHVTLISLNDFNAANAELKTPFTLAETRRNIVIEGNVQLHDLIGKRFTIGNVWFRGIEDCAPCKLPGNMAGKPKFESAFVGRGGLRAEVLSDGVISPGDSLVIV